MYMLGNAGALIGLKGVLDLADFKKATGDYLRSVDQMNRSNTGFAQKAGAQFLGLGNTVLKFGAIAAGVAIGGIAALGAGLFSATKDAMAAQEVQAQLEAVIKSTGGVAGVTAKQVNELADALSRQTKFDDEAIISGESLLLTFTKIGKDVFPLATETMLDMSQALGQDLNSSAIQLGKALQDPITGITALRRVGVNFTDAQKEMIEGLVKAGKLEEAQALILQELQTEFGGSAKAAGETFAGKLAILNTQLGNVKEAIGAVLIPILSKLIDKYLIPALPIIEEIAKGFGAFITVLGEGDIGGAFDALAEFFHNAGIDLPILYDIGGAIETVFAKIQEFGVALQPVVQQIFAFLAEHAEELKGALLGIGAVLAGAAITAAIAGIVGALGLLVSPLGLITAGVALLGAAWAGNWLGIRDVVTAVWNDFIKPVFDILVNYLQVAVPTAIAILTGFWNNSLLPAFNTLSAAFNENILPLLQQLYAWLAENIPLAVQTLADFWLTVLWPAISDVVDFIGANVIPVLTDIAVWLMENIPVAIQKASDFWTGTLRPALEQVWAYIQENILPIIADVVAWLQENLPAAIQTLSDFWNNTLLPALKDVWAYFSENIMPIIQDVIDIVVTLGEIHLLKLAKFWNETLLPALKDVWKYFNENILPILKDVRDFIVDEIGPKVQWFADKVIAPLANTLREGLAKAIEYVHGLLDKLLKKLQEYRDALKGVPIIGESPSPLEISLLGIGQAARLTTAEIEKLGKSLKDLDFKGLEKVFKIGGGFGSFGSSVAGRFQKQTLDPLKKRLDEIGKREDEIRKGIDEAGGNWLLQVELMKELNALEAERVGLQADYAAGQEKILALQKAQEDLAFLKTQMDFLTLIKENKLDVGEILGGLKLGLDADLPALIEAMTRAIRKMVEAAQDELDIGSPSGVFKEMGAQSNRGFEVGWESMMASTRRTIQDSLSMLSAPQPYYPPTTSQTFNLNMGSTTINSGMDEFAFQARLEQAMTRLMGG
jgi:hypothetical protein